MFQCTCRESRTRFLSLSNTHDDDDDGVDVEEIKFKNFTECALQREITQATHAYAEDLPCSDEDSRHQIAHAKQRQRVHTQTHTHKHMSVSSAGIGKDIRGMCIYGACVYDGTQHGTMLFHAHTQRSCNVAF